MKSQLLFGSLPSVDYNDDKLSSEDAVDNSNLLEGEEIEIIV